METSGQTNAAPHTGTTIVAVQYADGVVIGADSRVSTGRYVSNRASDKLTPLSDFVWLLRSGSAADTQLVGDYGALALSRNSCTNSLASYQLPLSCGGAAQCGTMQSSTPWSWTGSRLYTRWPSWSRRRAVKAWKTRDSVLIPLIETLLPSLQGTQFAAASVTTPIA